MFLCLVCLCNIFTTHAHSTFHFIFLMWKTTNDKPFDCFCPLTGLLKVLLQRRHGNPQIHDTLLRDIPLILDKGETRPQKFPRLKLPHGNHIAQRPGLRQLFKCRIRPRHSPQDHHRNQILIKLIRRLPHRQHPRHSLQQPVQILLQPPRLVQIRRPLQHTRHEVQLQERIENGDGGIDNVHHGHGAGRDRECGEVLHDMLDNRHDDGDISEGNAVAGDVVLIDQCV